MSLKELYKAMFSDGQQSREEFFSNTSSNSQDPFEADAKSGFDEFPEATDGLKRLDAKFGHQSRLPNLFFVAGISLVAALGVWQISQSNQKTLVDADPSSSAQTQTEQNNLIEKTDLILPDKFDSLTEVTKTNVEKVASLIQEQKSIQQNKETQTPEKSSFEIDDLPIRPPLTAESNEIRKQLTVKRRGKEISYHDFILIDYTGVRHNEPMEIDQLALSGTAASKENVASGDFLNEAWRKELIGYDAYIEKTAYFLKMGSFKNALTRFDIILQHFPDDLNALFYSGFALYNLGQFEKAQSFFIRGLQNPYTNFDEECAWYYALSLDANGEHQQAKKLFIQIAESTSFYKTQAKERLKQKK